MDNNDELILKLKGKSIEAFQMAIEIYNKPTIKYRIEGFALFICNAWELMLKAHMLNMNIDIYYKDNLDRTFSLEKCIQKVFTNDKDPLRLNLEKIIELRNISTHFITEEYEMVYVPLFQSCILNFNEKILKFHNIDMTEIIPQNFLTLSISMKALSDSEIIAKYPEEIATKLLITKDTIEDLAINNNANFAIRIDHRHYITKDKDKATSIVKIDNNADNNIKIVKELKDPNKTHGYTTKNCIRLIKEQLQKNSIIIKYNNQETKFNNFHFTNFCKYFGLKEKEEYCYIHRQFTTPQYSYSIRVIDFIFNEIKKDPTNILSKIKKG